MTRTLGFLGLAMIMLGGACASSGVPDRGPRAGGGRFSCGEIGYSAADIAVAVRMREDGAGRRDVVKRLGGTPADVRCAESMAKASRRGRPAGFFSLR